MTIGEIEVLLTEDIKLSRPTSDAQRFGALNYGRRKVIDLIRRVRPEWLIFERELIIPAQQIRVPLTGWGAVRRIKDIVALGPETTATLAGAVLLATDREVFFELASVGSDTYRRALHSPAEDSGVIYWDLLPQAAVPTLAVAPAQLTSLRCLVSYIDEPERWVETARGVPVSPVLADRETLIRAHAMEWLLRTVNDVEASAWRDIAVELTMEATEDMESVAMSATEAHSTALNFGDV